MIEIVPAILPKDYEDLKNKIAMVRGIAPMVQIDICDGVFVKSITWPFLGGNNLDEHFERILKEQEGMPFWEDVDFELDLMVSDAVQNFYIYSKLGPKRMIFHVEAVGNLEEFKEWLEAVDPYVKDSINIGVAINPSTPLENLFPNIDCIDFVQCMGNDEIGYHGVSLDEVVYEKIKILREKYSDLPIAIDIGVNMNTAPLL